MSASVSVGVWQGDLAVTIIADRGAILAAALACEDDWVSFGTKDNSTLMYLKLSDEGIKWIRGAHSNDSAEVVAARAAQALTLKNG